MVNWFLCPPGRQEKIRFSEELWGVQPSHWFQGKQSSLGSSLMLSPCPQGVWGCLWQPGSRAVWGSWPWCPALHCPLCPVPCGGINGVFSLSGVRAALKALHSEWSHLCPEPRAHHRFLPDHWRMQGNFHLPAWRSVYYLSFFKSTGRKKNESGTALMS